MTLGDIYKTISDEFKALGINTPSLDAEILITEVLSIARHKIISHPEMIISEADESLIMSYAERRKKREPIAYITGKKDFYGLEFSINSDVLIPRPDTEILVDTALFFAPQKSNLLDICTGSGAVAIALKYNRNDLNIFASDISDKCVAQAEKNAEIILGKSCIDFRKSDLFESFDGMKFSVITANPPYIDTEETDSLEPELFHEPRAALFSPGHGFFLADKIISSAERFLNDDGMLIMEIGALQEKAARTSAAKYGYKTVFTPDYSGINRVARLFR